VTAKSGLALGKRLLQKPLARANSQFKPRIFDLASVSIGGNISAVTKIRRGNYVFLSWKGDHSPRHVHVYRDGKLVLKWNLDDSVPMKGKPDSRLLQLIAALKKEGVL